MFIVLALTFRSLVLFEFIFVYDVHLCPFFFLMFIYLFIYLFRERERESERPHVRVPSLGGGQREREGERERISSRLCAVHAEPNMGLDLMNREIMT